MAVNGIKTLQDFTISVSKESKEAISGVYRPKGSVYFANLPALSSERIGFVYDIKDAFTTTSDFVEGSGKDYPIGTNVVIIEDEQGNIKYDCLAGIVVQESGLPAVNSDDNGKILKVVNGEWDKADNGNGYVEYVADGTKTFGQALAALYSLHTKSKVTHNSKLLLCYGTHNPLDQTMVFHCEQCGLEYGSSIFTNVSINDTGSGYDCSISTLSLSHGGTDLYFKGKVGSASVADYTNENCGNATFRLYY